MSRVHEGGKKEDFLYDHLSEKDQLWFDFMADTGDGGNSSYSVARLLAQPSLYALDKNRLQQLPRGDLLLIGGDLAYVNYTFTLPPFLYCLKSTRLTVCTLNLLCAFDNYALFIYECMHVCC